MVAITLTKNNISSIFKSLMNKVKNGNTVKMNIEENIDLLEEYSDDLKQQKSSISYKTLRKDLWIKKEDIYKDMKDNSKKYRNIVKTVNTK